MKKMNKKTFFSWRKASGAGLLAVGLALFSLGNSYGQCSPSTLPYTAPLSSTTTPAIPSCMSVEHFNTSSSGGDWETDDVTSYGFNGVTLKSSYTSYGDGPVDRWVYTNGLSLTGGVVYQVSFKYGNNSSYYTEKLAVAYGNDDTASAMTTLFDDTNITGATAIDKTIYFTPATTGTYYIGFHAHSDEDEFYLYVADIEVSLAPTCLAPSGITANNIASTTADINWTPPFTTVGNGYQYYYSTSSTAPTAGTTASGSSMDTFANLNGLTPNTEYYVWTRSVCSSTDTSAWTDNPLLFKTLCSTDTAPWTYDVETANTTTSSEIEDCWSSDPSYTSSDYRWDIDGSGSTPSSSTGPSGAHSGNNYFYTEASSGSTGDSAFLVSPLVDVSGLTLPALSFYYHMYGSTMGNLYIQVSSNGGVSWNTVDSIIGEQQTSASDPWLERFIVLSGYNGTINIRFAAVRGSDFYGDMSLDDISINEAPACITPTGLIANNITATSAMLNWDIPAIAPGNGYEYYYNTTGVSPTTTTTASGSVTDTFASLSSLTANTLYYTWVRSLCSSTDTSDWSALLSFRTPQIPATLPYDDDFTSTGGDWTMLGENQTNQWAAGSATGNLGNSMYISNDGGTSNAYTTSSATSVSQTYRDIVLTAGVNPFDLFFDWKCKGEGTTYPYDYFRVWIVPNTYEPTAGSQITASSSNGQQLGGNFNDPNGTGGWNTEHYIIPNTYAGDTVRLVFEWRNDGSSGSQPPAAIDNVSVSVITCVTPDNLNVENITTTTADINWETPVIVPGTGYDYYYNTSGTPPTSLTTASGSATDTFANLTGLTQNTTYYVWVRSDCSSSDQSYWSDVPLVFTTNCDVTNVPYTAPIAAANPPDMPDCMSDEALNPNDAEGWYLTSGYPGSSYGFNDNYFESDYTSSSDGPVDNWVYTNKINMNAGTWYKLTFKYGNNSSSYTEKLAVAYGSAATADSMGTPVFDDTNIELAGSTDTTVYFMVPTSGAYYIGFHAHSDANQYYLFLSDISVDSLPTCHVANSLIANNVTSHSANLAWFGTALKYRIEYGESGFTLGTGTQITTTSGTYQLTGLDPNTTYDFYVRDVCVPGVDSADWSVVGSFTTLCDTPSVNVGNDTSFCEGGQVILYSGNSDANSTVLWSNGATSDSIVVNSYGEYFATVTNEFGCTSADTVFINVKQYPDVELGNDTSICGNNTVVLDAGTQPMGTTFFWNTTATSQTITVSDSGWYKVIADNAGCVTTDSVHISKGEMPTVSGITGTSVNTNCTFDFVAMNPENVNSYYWDFGDGSNATGTNPSHTYSGGGNYTVKLVVSNDCASDSVVTSVSCSNLGIGQLDLSNEQLKLYPNPAKDRLILQNESVYKMESITVYNVLGQVMFKGKANTSDKYILNVQSYASGMYNVKITFKNGSWIQRKFEIRK